MVYNISLLSTNHYYHKAAVSAMLEDDLDHLREVELAYGVNKLLAIIEQCDDVSTIRRCADELKSLNGIDGDKLWAYAKKQHHLHALDLL